ncbi:unnamed protein product [Echinostoma caproni]|uniref:DUF4704 domain-containing protein n=1 Tax=Echinostoma caproni TaxID=27848 RepID=A0A183B404_9TREM|nr:unnamed protein product [Echinostoma caproni]
MGTPRGTPMRKIAGGSYLHFGLEECPQCAMDVMESPDLKCIYLQLHADGLSPFRNSIVRLWPILGRTMKPLFRVFLVGLFCGMSKPGDVHKYLSETIEALGQLTSTGVRLQMNAKLVKAILHSILSDAPAKSYIKQVKQLSGL